LCDQDQETIDHILVGCVFARSFWFQLLGQVNLPGFAPQLGEVKTMEWWSRISEQLQGIAKKGLNFLITLGYGLSGTIEMGAFFTELNPVWRELLEELKKLLYGSSRGLNTLPLLQLPF
jgi:hypothetical protein